MKCVIILQQLKVLAKLWTIILWLTLQLGSCFDFKGLIEVLPWFLCVWITIRCVQITMENLNTHYYKYSRHTKLECIALYLETCEFVKIIDSDNGIMGVSSQNICAMSDGFWDIYI